MMEHNKKKSKENHLQEKKIMKKIKDVPYVHHNSEFKYHCNKHVKGSSQKSGQHA